jgi:hypothetical protein
MAFSEAADYHDQYVDAVTQFKPTHMNLPIDQLDYQIGVNVAAILLRLQATNFVCADNEIVCNNNEPVIIGI